MQENRTSVGLHDAITRSTESVLEAIDHLERPPGEAEGHMAGLRQACGTLRRVNRVLLSLRRLLWEISGGLRPGEIIHRVCGSLVEVGGYETVWIVLIDPEGRCQAWAHGGLGEEAVALGHALERGWTPQCGRELVASETGALLIRGAESCGAECPLGKACWQRGGIVVRLSWGGRSLGMMTFASPSAGGGVGDEEVLLITEVAAEVSHALHDLTMAAERAETEAGLKESRRAMATLLGNLPGMAYRCNVDDQWTMDVVSEGSLALTGYRADELIGNRVCSYNALIHPEDRDKVRAAVCEGMGGSGFFEVEYRLTDRDGAEKWVWERGTVVRHESSGVVLEGFVTDISRRKRALEHLEQSNQRYRAYIASSPVGIFIASEAGRYVEVNDAACRMVGYTREELLGLHVKDLSLSPDTKGGSGDFERLKDRGRLRQEISLRHKTGGVVYGVLEAVTLEDGLYMAYVVDQTEQRTLQAQLNRVQKIESVGRVAAGVAHDFNNMLSPILGYAELLIDDLPPGSESHGYAQEIKNAAERSRNLIRQLLVFSRKQVLSLETVDMREIVSGMQALFRRTLREDIAMVLDLDEIPCFVRVDVGQVEQILMNLAVNAQDAMPDGGRLSLSVCIAPAGAVNGLSPSVGSGGRGVLLEVSDTGHGMDADTVERVFEPFFTTKGKGGTGLGLSTVYGIVTQHGGSVSVDTAVGQGTRFALFFPLAPEPQIEPEEPSEEPRCTVSGDETVLVVEDSEGVRNMALNVLKRRGYRVHHADGAEAALKVMGDLNGRVDLLLTDVVMPGMNGRELYTRVAERYPGVRVLYMSGHTDDVIAHRGMLEAGIDFIQKPFAIEALIRKVREVLDAG